MIMIDKPCNQEDPTNTAQQQFTFRCYQLHQKHNLDVPTRHW